MEPITAGSSGSTSSSTPWPTTTTTDAPSTSSAPTTGAGAAQGSVTVGRTLATGLRVPWELALLPNGSVLVSARDSFQIFSVNLGSGRPSLLGSVEGAVSNVSQAGEGGLLGIAVSPSFPRRPARLRVLLDGRRTTASRPSRRTRASAGAQQLGAPRSRQRHPAQRPPQRGPVRVRAGRFLYATTGEAEDPALAQDKGSLGGKILRMTPPGVRAGQPVRDAGVDLGHRNVQGIAWDPAGRIGRPSSATSWWTSSTSSAGQGLRVAATQGRTSPAGHTGPVAQWGTDEDSPSGIAYAAGASGWRP